MHTKSLLVRKTWIYSGIYLFWMSLLVYLSLKPDLRGPGIEIPYFDKLAHMGFYFVASFLFLISLEKTSLFRLKKNTKVFITLILHACIGALIEYIQHYYVSGRAGEIADFLANLLGVTIAIILYYSRWNYFCKSN